jgi:hypothetical protein
MQNVNCKMKTEESAISNQQSHSAFFILQFARCVFQYLLPIIFSDSSVVKNSYSFFAPR